MKCSAWEQKIYLYDELSTHEQQEIDAHVTTCAHCMQAQERVRAMRNAMTLLRVQEPSLANHAAMTRRVMDAVGDTPQKTHSPFERFVSRYVQKFKVEDVVKVRYHMAALSFLLAAFFVLEYYADGKQMEVFKHYPTRPPTTELDLAAFHSAFLQTKKENKQASTGLSDCIARCLNTSTSGCKECAGKFSKP